MASDALLRNVTLKTVWDQRRALMGWSIGILLLCFLMSAFYPSVRDSAEEFEQILDAYPPAFKAFFGELSDFSTPAGYLQAELFSFMLPILFLVYLIGRGSDTIAGEEERGSLDLLLSHPVSRRMVVLQKAGAMVAGALLLSGVAYVTLVLGAFAFGMDMTDLHLAAGVTMVLLLALLFGMLALAVGSLRGRKGLAIATAAGLAVLSYVLDSLANLADWIEPVRLVLPFHYYNDAQPLRNGLDWLDASVLLVTTAALLAVAVWGFERRDVGT